MSHPQLWRGAPHRETQTKETVKRPSITNLIVCCRTANADLQRVLIVKPSALTISVPRVQISVWLGRR